MIIVVPDYTNVPRLHDALYSQGFRLKHIEAGTFLLTTVDHSHALELTDDQIMALAFDSGIEQYLFPEGTEEMHCFKSELLSFAKALQSRTLINAGDLHVPSSTSTHPRPSDRPDHEPTGG